MFKRSALFLFSALLAASLLLSACSSRTTNIDVPTLKIVSSLALTGDSKPQADAIANGMLLRVEQAYNQACGGKYRLAYESWDDSSVELGKWDADLEKANAQAAAADPTVIAYLGTYNSGAAKVAIPILNQAGPMVMISPANTYPGLTRAVEGVTERSEPDVYYQATGVRNYVRLVATDDLQGPVQINFMASQNVRTLYILHDGEVYGRGLADAVEIAAKKSNIKVVGKEQYNPQALNYFSLMKKIAVSNEGSLPDAIFVGGIVGNNIGKLLRDKVEILGDNARVKFIGGDGIYTEGLIEAAGADIAEGVFAATPGLALKDLGADGKRFYQDYAARFGATEEPYAIFGYEAMNVAVNAIENICAAGGNPADRKSVRYEVMNTKGFKGALGTWSFDENGDITLPFFLVGQVQGGKFVQFGTYSP
ncbi:MAG: hypothetical protein Fur002_21560 [Anaerolineales bacterium]